MAAFALSPSSPPREKSASLKISGRASATHSRSTSAGSAPSESHGSIDLHRLLQDSPVLSHAYPSSSTLELPQYDYPTPWSIQNTCQIPGADFPAPLLVKNTFFGFDPVRPASLEEFYEERKTQSCPASGIGLPPGLEDLVTPEAAAAKLVEAEAFHDAATDDNELEWRAERLLPIGLLDASVDADLQEFFPLQQCPDNPSGYDIPHANAQALSMPLSVQHAPECYLQLPTVLPAAPTFAPRQSPIVLDLDRALGSPYDVDEMQQHNLQLGSIECPTVGSMGHWSGTCKPCAFLYTKGCNNGIACEFCHLCDAGEKKRRAKEKRSAYRGAKPRGC